MCVSRSGSGIYGGNILKMGKKCVFSFFLFTFVEDGSCYGQEGSMYLKIKAAMRSLSFILALFLFLPLQAQDKIVTNEGDVIQAYHVDVGENLIYYRLENFGAGVLQSIRKADVLMLMRQDGSIVNYYQDKKKDKVQPEDTVATGNASDKVKILESADLSETSRKANAALIEAMNGAVIAHENGNEDAQTADAVWCRLGVKKNSILCNDDLELSVTAGKLVPASGEQKNVTFIPGNGEIRDVALSISVRNKGNRTVYVDLGNSYFIRMGEFISYYASPASTTVYSAPVESASMAAVAGSEADGQARTIQVDGTARVIALAPNTVMNLQARSLFQREPGDIIAGLKYVTEEAGKKHAYQLAFRFPEQGAEGELKLGEHLAYASSASPMNFSFAVSYADTGDCAQEKTMLAHFYLKDLVGVELGGISKEDRKVKIASDGKAVSFMGLCSDEPGDPFPLP